MDTEGVGTIRTAFLFQIFGRVIVAGDGLFRSRSA
jgi:hypothetical protein